MSRVNMSWEVPSIFASVMRGIVLNLRGLRRTLPKGRKDGRRWCKGCSRRRQHLLRSGFGDTFDQVVGFPELNADGGAQLIGEAAHFDTSPRRCRLAATSRMLPRRAGCPEKMRRSVVGVTVSAAAARLTPRASTSPLRARRSLVFSSYPMGFTKPRAPASDESPLWGLVLSGGPCAFGCCVNGFGDFLHDLTDGHPGLFYGQRRWPIPEQNRCRGRLVAGWLGPAPAAAE